MSRYKAYAEYKDSNIQWLGKLPSNWGIVKLGYFYKIAMGQTILKEDLVEDGEWPVFSATEGDHYFGHVNSPNVKLGYGDFVIPARGNSIGAVKIVKEKSTTTQTTIYCQQLFRDKFFPNYLYYYLVGLRLYLFHFTQTAIPQITTEEVASKLVVMPPIGVQQTIANFLDHETAKIDTLIAKQQELIKLLKEKRQAVISHAVTKGLNPNAPMRDSGVEWFREIPSSWCVTKLKYLVEQIVDGAHFTPTYVEDGVPFLRVTDIQSAVIDKVNIKYIPLNEHNELIKRCRPGRGDLLLSKNGTIGIPKIVDWDWEFSIFVSLCLIRLGKKIDVEYAYFFFLTSQISEQISSLVKQSTVINLHLDKIANFEFTLPPLPQQREIVVYLKENLSNYDSQIDAAMQMNQLLHERRTALISAAVTGKIDVRDWQPPSETAIAA